MQGAVKGAMIKAMLGRKHWSIMLMTRHLPMRASLVVLGLAASTGGLAAQPLQLQPAKPAIAAAKPARAAPLPPIRPEGLGLPRGAIAAGAATSPAAPIQTATAEPVRVAAAPAKPAGRPSAPLSQ